MSDVPGFEENSNKFKNFCEKYNDKKRPCVKIIDANEYKKDIKDTKDTKDSDKHYQNYKKLLNENFKKINKSFGRLFHSNSQKLRQRRAPKGLNFLKFQC